MPHVIIIRAIQIRAPTFIMMRLLGISAMKYPKKNRPAPMPKAVGVRPMSLFMVSAAKPTFTRSR